ncbi:MAG: biliverdin-producing heme oxygenase [Myxococcota bacterium]
MKPLSVRLKEGTKVAHTQAEESPFIRRFFTGQIDRSTYTALLHRLLPIYRALEAPSGRAHIVYDTVDIDLMARATAIEDDLTFFGQDPLAFPPSPSVQRYVERINYAAEHAPHLYLAHAYTRYLGDLSGGQVLKKIVQKTFGLCDGEGVSFYLFPKIPHLHAFKQTFRKGIDALLLSEIQHAEVVDEAVLSFSMNRSIFDELEARSAPAEA